jgi:hypothetical protein
MATAPVLELIPRIDNLQDGQSRMETTLNRMAISQEGINTSLAQLAGLTKVLVHWVIIPLTLMVFILALLFAGVKFVEISDLIKANTIKLHSPD